MVDVFGNEVNVGDEVAFTEPWYHNLAIGIVIRITDKSFIVEPYNDERNTASIVRKIERRERNGKRYTVPRWQVAKNLKEK